MASMLVSCHSSKNVGPDNNVLSSVSVVGGAESKFPATEAGTVFVNKVIANRTEVSNLTSKVKVNVQSGSKKISTSGTLRMRRGDVIQISLLDPLLGVTEVGRLEFSPKKVVLIDRINKQYVDDTYDNIDFLRKANIDFNALQAMFWNELFVPGQAKPQAKNFQVGSPQGKEIVLNFTDKILKYSFHALEEDASLRKTEITGVQSNAYSFDFDYSDFKLFNGKDFPRGIMLTFLSSGKKMSLSFQLNAPNTNSNWEVHTKLPSGKYTKITAERFFNMITNL
jgi:hypothetical protein